MGKLSPAWFIPLFLVWPAHADARDFQSCDAVHTYVVRQFDADERSSNKFALKETLARLSDFISRHSTSPSSFSSFVESGFQRRLAL